jgi:hypothetical protein
VAGPTSKRERIFTGIAVVVILALAFWLFLGRSPSGGPKRVEVELRESVETDRGTVTVFSLDPAAALGAPAPDPGHEVEAIRFRSCRSDSGGTVVDMSAFSVTFADDPAAEAAGSRLERNDATCVAGQVFVQAPEGATPTAVEYAADPVGVWRLPAG